MSNRHSFGWPDAYRVILQQIKLCSLERVFPVEHHSTIFTSCLQSEEKPPNLRLNYSFKIMSFERNGQNTKFFSDFARTLFVKNNRCKRHHPYRLLRSWKNGNFIFLDEPINKCVAGSATSSCYWIFESLRHAFTFIYTTISTFIWSYRSRAHTSLTEIIARNNICADFIFGRRSLLCTTA